MNKKSIVVPLLAAISLIAIAGGARAGDITVSDPFARASAGMAKAGAAFLTLKNAGAADDQLMSASTPVAEHAELHAHIRDGDVIRMRQIDFIEVPAGQTVSLEPGGLHVMLIDLKAPLQEGQEFPLTLTFATAGDITIDVPVKSAAEMAPMSQH
jgi:copper(I)-binding protein